LKINKIELSWFRGAAEQAVLDTNGKSVVVYGDNASGKSSFVDSVEYIISNGKIHHLRHEYSDRDYRNCIRNTVTPDEITSYACIHFDDGNYVKVKIPLEDKITYEGNSPEFLASIQEWGVFGHILRQDEISDFIKNTKSKKYSALLPLLGLDKYEQTADNVDKIFEAIIKESNYDNIKGRLNTIEEDINRFFRNMDNEIIHETVLSHAKKYIDIEPEKDIIDISNESISRLNELSKQLEPDIKRYTILEGIKQTNLKLKIESMETSDYEVAEIGDFFIDYRLDVLENSLKILNSTEDLSAEIECPACGRNIIGTEFKEHVDEELEILKKAREIRSKAIVNRRGVASSLSQIRNRYKSDETFNQWLSLPENEEIRKAFNKIEEFKEGDTSTRWENGIISELKFISTELLSCIEKELESEPPSMGSIIDDHDFFRTALKIPSYKILVTKITALDRVRSDYDEIRKRIRESISEITIKTLENITHEISRIWGIIHPGQLIEEIQLIPSSEKDRALDISLKFYGKNQPSPRLTLSEGYRNSLGLSIFLALANQEQNRGHPIFLDDIISSLDREHRGMIADILKDELANRQTFLLTHDREWFDELNRRLSRRDWNFYTLKKWTSPQEGIQVMPTHYTFDEAQSFLPDHTNSCGNAVRAILDTELPRIALKLEVPMPYLQGANNDHRTCVDLLKYIISKGKESFKTRKNGTWKIYQKALDDMQEVRNLMITWGNRASHGGSLTVPEAERLIEVSRKLLKYRTCQNCESKIWKLSHPEYVRCDCGQYRWYK